MTPRERFLYVMNFDVNIDRLPMVEWAAWWDLTINRWISEGMPRLDFMESQAHFGLDPMVTLGFGSHTDKLPAPDFFGGPIINGSRSYHDIKKYLYADELIDKTINQAKEMKRSHENGEIIIRLWLDGFFWFPRTLLGIESHLFAFYDNPDLIHRINLDLADYNIRVIEAICSEIKPDMVGFAEDMSYNHGPMLSKAMFDEFLLPYYRKVIPHIKQKEIKVLVDSDGDITTMIPWMIEAGIEGAYPLERQAGVDINTIRTLYPRFLMMGGYDKMVMPLSEGAMRNEFERILPAMKSGGYIPSVDHQTPPGVSLHNYQVYIDLMKEYCLKATGGARIAQ